MNTHEIMTAFATGWRRGASGKDPKENEVNYLRGYQDGVRAAQFAFNVERDRLGLVSGPDTARMFASQLVPPSDTKEAQDAAAVIAHPDATHIEAFTHMHEDTRETAPMSIGDVDRAIGEDDMLGKFAKLRQLNALRAEIGNAPRVRSGAEIVHEFDDRGAKVTPRASSTVTETDGSFQKSGTDAIAWAAPKNGAATENRVPSGSAMHDGAAPDFAAQARAGIFSAFAPVPALKHSFEVEPAVAVEPVVPDARIAPLGHCQSTTHAVKRAREVTCPFCLHVVTSSTPVTGMWTIAEHVTVK